MISTSRWGELNIAQKWADWAWHKLDTFTCLGQGDPQDAATSMVSLTALRIQLANVINARQSKPLISPTQKKTQDHSSIFLRVLFEPQGWCIGTPYYPFSTPWKIQAECKNVMSSCFFVETPNHPDTPFGVDHRGIEAQGDDFQLKKTPFLSQPQKSPNISLLAGFPAATVSFVRRKTKENYIERI